MILHSVEFRSLLESLVVAPAFSAELGSEFAAVGAVRGISACRMLRSCLNLPLKRFFALLTELFDAFMSSDTRRIWTELANGIRHSDSGKRKLIAYLTVDIDDTALRASYADFAQRLERENPHAVYPTSPYRECTGTVESTADGQRIEAVMTMSTFASMQIVDRTLDVDQPLLRDLYASLGRCVCFIDETVDTLHGDSLMHYFAYHDIPLVKHVYRSLEVDKTIGTVERMLGDLKAAGISRNEPVLVVGGGVLADTAGLACSLYGRSTPYVMLATSIVSGIDAGPSPRTCCDGYGYKNLLGAYHSPTVSVVDRYFFKTLRPIWLRHGVAEIIKISAVCDAELFADLETAQADLVDSKFGTVGCEDGAPIQALSKKILGAALRAYVTAEYDNMYETHQCRPHAYGHTWSPGFEIQADLLHGHAVAVCMGLGAYVSRRLGWIDERSFRRILNLISGYGLSLWHDIVGDKELIWKSQQIVIQKRGQNLVAPLPKRAIGECGYLNELSRADLFSAIDEYKAVCATYPRHGFGIEALCSDAGPTGTLEASIPSLLDSATIR